MRVNWQQKLVDTKNVAFKDKDGEVTLGKLAVDCLTGMTESEKSMDGKEKYNLYRLAMKIEDEPDSDFSTDDIAKVKDHIGRKTMTLLVGRAYDIIESGDTASTTSFFKSKTK